MLRNKIFILFGIFTIVVIWISYGLAQEIKRDPFISLITEDGRLISFKDKKQEKLELEGILFDSYGIASAIVNSEIVKVGDWIGEYQIYKIEPDKIILLKEGKELILKLEKEDEK